MPCSWVLVLGILLGFGIWCLGFFLQLFLKLFHLWPDGCPAVLLLGMAAIKILMMLLGFVKLRQRDNLGHNWTAELLLRFGLRSFRGGFLLQTVVKNDRTVLSAGVMALPI